MTPLIVSKPLTTSSQFASSPFSPVAPSSAATTAPGKTDDLNERREVNLGRVTVVVESEEDPVRESIVVVTGLAR